MNRDKDIMPRNTNGHRHGYWEVYWWNGDLRYKCVFNNGDGIGYEELYNYLDGKLKVKGFYL